MSRAERFRAAKKIPALLNQKASVKLHSLAMKAGAALIPASEMLRLSTDEQSVRTNLIEAIRTHCPESSEDSAVIELKAQATGALAALGVVTSAYVAYIEALEKIPALKGKPLKLIVQHEILEGMDLSQAGNIERSERFALARHHIPRPIKVIYFKLDSRESA